MKRIFITYGNEGFEKTKKRIIHEAEAIGEFDEIYAYGPEDLSKEVLSSDIFKHRRGGGYWIWKPDVILSTLAAHADGDLIVYCDAGCSLYASSEWNRYWNRLSSCDIIAQRILQPSERWTREELITFFSSNGDRWLKDCQYLSGAIFIKNSPFSQSFVKEWREIMINHPEFIVDVPADQRHLQHAAFIESRHDQSVFSALIYKYRLNPSTRHWVYTQWEHVEFYDIFRKQAIRATRLRRGEEETVKTKLVDIRRRIGVDFLLKPFYYVVSHWWYNR